MPLAHLQQDGLFQHDGERLVLLVLLVVNDLHVQHLPAGTGGQGSEVGTGATHSATRLLFISVSQSFVNTRPVLRKIESKNRQQVGPVALQDPFE